MSVPPVSLGQFQDATGGLRPEAAGQGRPQGRAGQGRAGRRAGQRPQGRAGRSHGHNYSDTALRLDLSTHIHTRHRLSYSYSGLYFK